MPSPRRRGGQAWAEDIDVDDDSKLRAAIAKDGANIIVTANIDLSNSTLNIAEGKTVTIDLKGHTLDRGLTAREWNTGGQVITVRNGATLNIKNGTLKGGWGGNGGGIENTGTTNLTDVNITGCTGDDRGGAISNSGTLTMTRGSITYNTSKDRTAPTGGGGLFNYEGATATLTNITISGNQATVTGGGGICNYGTMTLDGCTITGNSCKMNGGSIWQGASATLNVTGLMTVTGNTSDGGATNNLFLKTNAVVTITGSLQGSSVGINMEALTGTFTSGYGTYNNGVEPSTLFSADIPMVMNITSDGTEAQLAYKATISYIGRSWDKDNKVVVSTVKELTNQIAGNTTPTSEADYKLVTGGSGEFDLGGKTGSVPEIYVVRGGINRDVVRVKGTDVHLVLCDGARLNVNSIIVNPAYKLYIHVQSYGPSMGKLHADNNGHQETAAGIGSESGLSHAPNLDGPGLIEIHGGTIYAKGGDNGAGIGGGDWAKGGNIVIYGGDIRAYGGDGGGTDGSGGAGIGGGNLAEGPINFTIYDGSVYAEGGPDAAGIGSGNCGNNFDYTIHHSGHFTMYGGYVEAHGADNAAGIGGGEYSEGPKGVNIYGGTVKAYGGDDAAGIGGGYHWAKELSSGTIHISGGEVYAWGKSEGAGIGGGENGKGADVTITGGIVEAHAGENKTYYKAIGPGRDNDDYGTLKLGDNMMVSSERLAYAAERKNMCWYRTEARIEPCTHSITYTISGSGERDTHTAHCQYCTTAFAAEEHTFNDNGICTVCGVQSTTTLYTVRTYLPSKSKEAYDGQTYSCQTSKMASNSTFALPDCPTIVPGLEFKGWEVSNVTKDPYSSQYTSDGETRKAHTEYTINGDVSFIARYQVLDISLADNANNSLTLLQYGGMKAHSVTLKDRILYKDGDWNTLCLPFNVADNALTGDFANATLMELDTEGWYEGSTRYDEEASGRRQTGFDRETGTLYLYFQTATSIVAGKPYIIKWGSGSNITDPGFSNVTINNVLYGVHSKDNTVDFAGTYSPRTLTGGDRNILYLGAENKLYYPSAGKTINACRAYFQLRGITAGDILQSSVKMYFGDEDADGIGTIQNPDFRIQGEADAWYSLDGRKLSGKPNQRGIYINNGKKE